MFRRFRTDAFNWILIIGVILLIAEIIFSFGSTIIPTLLFIVLLFIGWKNFHKLWGKILFWFFFLCTVISVLNIWAVRFFIVAVLVLFVFEYVKSKKQTETLIPSLPGKIINQEDMVKIDPLFDHKLFGNQKTEDNAYQWRDINIYGAFGNRIIDLSNTVLPQDTAVISIRHIMGKIEIYVPYEVEVSIHHSSVIGRAHIFSQHHWELMNKSLFYQTENYDTSYPRVKIITSIFSGDIEVKRI